MKSLKEMKYLLLDLDGVCYGSHNGYPLEKVFGLVSKRMTLFIQEKLGLDEKKWDFSDIHGMFVGHN